MYGFVSKTFKQVRSLPKCGRIDSNTNKSLYKGLEANFEKASSGSTNTFGVPYDYGSVMHYSSSAFSKNGQPTIVALVSKAKVISFSLLILTLLLCLSQPLCTFLSTLFPLQSSNQFRNSRMGQREGFSDNDIRKLMNMYCT